MFENNRKINGLKIPVHKIQQNYKKINIHVIIVNIDCEENLRMKKHIESRKSWQDRQSKHFICNCCDENVNSARNLTRHKSSKHEKLFEYTCYHWGDFISKVIHFK